MSMYHRVAHEHAWRHERQREVTHCFLSTNRDVVALGDATARRDAARVRDADSSGVAQVAALDRPHRAAREETDAVRKGQEWAAL